MRQFLLSGRNANGREVTERIDASSADEAMRVFTGRGYQDVTLHTDDVGSLYINQKTVQAVVSPADFRRLSLMPQWLIGTWIATKAIYRSTWYWHIGAVCLFGYRRYQELGWNWTDTWILIILINPLIFALLAQLVGGPGRRYRSLIDAVAWGRWEEVLDLADKVKAPVGKESILFEKAKALSALGRLDEALELVSPLGNGREMPLWHYWSRMAAVYSTGNHRDESKAALEKALELAPENVTLLTDKAYSEVWLRRNPRLAAEYLARLKGHAVSEMVKVWIDRTEGLIALEKGDGTQARELLEKAFQGSSKYRHATPLIGQSLDFIHAQLALAYAAEGDIDEARRHYALARPRLVALKKHEDIARCEQALGLTANA